MRNIDKKERKYVGTVFKGRLFDVEMGVFDGKERNELEERKDNMKG